MNTLAAKAKRDDFKLMVYDKSRACFHAKTIRPVCVEIIDEDFEQGDGDKCGRLKYQCKAREMPFSIDMDTTNPIQKDWDSNQEKTLHVYSITKTQICECSFTDTIRS